MTLNLSPRDNQLQAILKKYLAEHLPSEDLRKQMSSGWAANPLWNELVELGIFEVFAAERGEISLTDACLLIQECTARLVPAPCAEQLLFGSHFFGQYLAVAVRTDLESRGLGVSDIVSGKTGISVGSGQVVFDQSNVSGSITYVPLVPEVQYVMVPGPDAVYVLSLRSEGVAQCSCNCIDITRAYYEITCIAAPAWRIPVSPDYFNDMQALLIVHEVYGMLDRVLSMTVEYLQTRKQFGVPVGGFQAIQQSLASMKIVVEALGSLALFAAWALEHDTDQSSLALEAALRYALDQGLTVLENAVQAHGGIGFTWEYDLHLYLRRLMLHRALSSSRRADISRLLTAAQKL